MFQTIQSDQRKEESRELAAEEVNSCEDPVRMLEKIFVDINMGDKIAGGVYPVPRSVFVKPHGVARGTFKINSNLPDRLRVGVFKHDEFPAWVRFSSDADPFTPDLETPLGIAIKLFGVPGKKLLDSEEYANTHDFILQNHDVFFVDTALDMCEWAHARVKRMPENEDTKQKRKNTKKAVTSLLDTPYWSILPYAFGSDFVKYKLEPGSSAGRRSTTDDLRDDPNHLRQDLRRRLLVGDASFKFCLQFRTDPVNMPLDKATVRWEETVSSPVFVATLIIHKQDIDERGQAAYGENLAYNPWHALPEHSPEGSIAKARKVVYQAGAELRRNLNGIPIAEPRKPR